MASWWRELMAANVKVNYDFNYKKGSWLWDNKLITSYGLTNNEDDGVRKMMTVLNLTL